MRALKRSRQRKIIASFCTVIGLGFGYWLLLLWPAFMFPYGVTYGLVTLHSDQPFNPERGKKILAAPEARLRASPLVRADDHFDAFVCNSAWRRVLFMRQNYNVGGVNIYPFTTNIFLRQSDIDTDSVISPSGNPVSPERPLSYFIAHEITHTLTGRAVGALQQWRMPRWVREGYADYVGRGDRFKIDAATQALRANDPTMSWERSGLYYLYHLEIAWLLEREHWPLEQLLGSEVTDTEMESRIRAVVASIPDDKK